MHPDDGAALDQTFARATLGDPFVVDVRVIGRAGTPRWLVVRGTAHARASGKVTLAGIVVDITAHQMAQNERERLLGELAAERARLNALVQNLPAAVVEAEAGSGKIVSANPAFETILRRNKKPGTCFELVTTHPARHPDGRDLELAERPVMRALAGEDVSSEDYLYSTSDGGEVWVRLAAAPIRNEVGEITSAVVVAFDVDREKRAEAALRATQSRLNQLFTSPVVGLFSSKLDGRITDANDEFLRVVGYTRDDLVTGKLSWRELTPPDLYETDEKKRSELVATGSHPPFEKAYVRKDGKRLPILIGSTMLADSKTDVMTVALDMSEKKRSEQERETLLASLERSEERYRLAALATNDVIWDWDLVTGCVNFRSIFDSDLESLKCCDEWSARLATSRRYDDSKNSNDS